MRKAISTRTRFEIFKRDKFTCQYCGQRPPIVILHVDHILAVANGGGNERENLATSCDACNFGKAAVPLQSVVEPIKQTLKEEREKRKQLSQYNAWLKEIQVARNADFMAVSDAMMAVCGEAPAEKVISGSWAATVRSLLNRLPAQKIIEAVQIADDRFPFKSGSHRSFKYFCGVCWRTVDRGGMSL